MEYYISKDKNIAFKIFELGLKRYSDEPNYLLAYIDHLSHLSGKETKTLRNLMYVQFTCTCNLSFISEDNNTRVLFEKAVSSVPSDKARSVGQPLIICTVCPLEPSDSSLSLSLSLSLSHSHTVKSGRNLLSSSLVWVILPLSSK